MLHHSSCRLPAAGQQNEVIICHGPGVDAAVQARPNGPPSLPARLPEVMHGSAGDIWNRFFTTQAAMNLQYVDTTLRC